MAFARVPLLAASAAMTALSLLLSLSLAAALTPLALTLPSEPRRQLLAFDSFGVDVDLTRLECLPTFALPPAQEAVSACAPTTKLFNLACAPGFLLAPLGGGADGGAAVEPATAQQL